jgi:hypothetical protein
MAEIPARAAEEAAMVAVAGVVLLDRLPGLTAADLARRYSPPDLEHIRRARDMSSHDRPVRLDSEAGPAGGEGTRS